MNTSTTPHQYPSRTLAWQIMAESVTCRWGRREGRRPAHHRTGQLLYCLGPAPCSRVALSEAAGLVVDVAVVVVEEGVQVASGGFDGPTSESLKSSRGTATWISTGSTNPGVQVSRCSLCTSGILKPKAPHHLPDGILSSRRGVPGRRRSKTVVY